MFRHNFLLIYRNFKRFKSTFFINLIGLSTGMACTLLIYMWVADELEMDKFHQNNHRIFQVLTNQHQTERIVTLGDGPGLLGEGLEEEISEIEDAVSCTEVGDAMQKHSFFLSQCSFSCWLTLSNQDTQSSTQNCSLFIPH